MAQSAVQTLDVYICTGRGKSENAPPNAGGIQLCLFALADGALTPVSFISDPPSAGHLAAHPDGRHIYGLHGLREVNGQPGSGASAYRVNDQSGALTLLSLRSVHGLWPSYIAFDSSGRWLIAVNYGTGNVAVLPILADGTLGEATQVIQHEGSSVNPERQKEPHAHSVVVDPTGHCALVADLGIDQIVIYHLDSAQNILTLRKTGTLMTSPGSGPRHLAYHPNGRFLYCTNELESTVTIFAGDANEGTLREIQTVSTLPTDYQGNNSPAHLQFAPSGKTLYVSNRGHDSIAAFSVNHESGRLTLASHTPTEGNAPRHFAIDPTGQYLLAGNERSSTLATFRIDAHTGSLLRIAMTDMPYPVFVLFRQRQR